MDSGQLVSKRDEFQVQRGARLDKQSERVEQRDDDGPHACRLSENAGNLNRRNTYEVLGSDNSARRHAVVVQAGSDGLSSPRARPRRSIGAVVTPPCSMLTPSRRAATITWCCILQGLYD